MAGTRARRPRHVRGFLALSVRTVGKCFHFASNFGRGRRAVAFPGIPLNHEVWRTRSLFKMAKPNNKDVIFLFGAGASYGAGGVLPEQPPLGFQLYSILERTYPGSWGSLSTDIRAAFRKDFEQGMQLVHDRFGAAIPSLMREMAVYFVQFRPHNRATLYCRLIEDLSQNGLLERTILSTLNYECLLEFSLVNHGHGIAYFDEGRVHL